MKNQPRIDPIGKGYGYAKAYMYISDYLPGCGKLVAHQGTVKPRWAFKVPVLTHEERGWFISLN